MLIKIHSTYRNLIAICDKELKGKVFKQGKFVLNIREDFYNGEEKTEQEIRKIMQTMVMEDAMFNIVGKKSTETAIKAGIINPKNIKTVQGIPFILILL
jgi:uncharacterized protein